MTNSTKEIFSAKKISLPVYALLIFTSAVAFSLLLWHVIAIILR